MRNGKALLTHKALAAACTFCLLVWGTASNAGAADASQMESGAPSAIVMFPVTDADASAASMKPVVFNHQIHEKAVENCKTCHHAGEVKQSCTTCHTVEGKAEGGNVTLEGAMHATNIKAAADGSKPTSCVSCHEEQLKQRDCAGCHSVITPTRGEQWCGVCHNVAATPEQVKAGAKKALSADDAKAMVEAAQKTQPAVDANVPARIKIDGLSNEFYGNMFNHRRHANLIETANEKSTLAKAFHNEANLSCTTCHHHSPLSANPPKCGSCHSKTIDPAHPERPSLKAAYHLQCMGCHTAMDVKPANTSCKSCHRPQAAND